MGDSPPSVIVQPKEKARERERERERARRRGMGGIGGALSLNKEFYKNQG